MLSTHIIPASATKLPPCQLLCNRMLETYFSKLRPADLSQPSTNHISLFAEDQPLWALSYSANRKSWAKATMLRQIGYRTYLVTMEDGKVHKRHFNQLRKREPDDTKSDFLLTTPIRQRDDDDEAVEYLPMSDHYCQPGPSGKGPKTPDLPTRLTLIKTSPISSSLEDLCEDDQSEGSGPPELIQNDGLQRPARPKKRPSYFQVKWD